MSESIALELPEPLAKKVNVRSMAKNRCGYCLSPQKLVMARLEIEHIIPVSKSGSSGESNLWLACPICNSHKAGKIEAIDPVTNKVLALLNRRTQVWADCFRSSNTQHIQLSEQIQDHLSNYRY